MKTLFIIFFGLIAIITLSTNSFAQDASLGRAPVNNNVKHSINYGNHIDGSTIGYGSDGTGDGWYSVDIDSGSLTLIGPPTGTFNMGGDFDGSGTYYATRFPDTLVTVDPETGAESIVAAITGVPGDHTITSMAWDATTNTMFLGSTDLSISQLFTINLATGVATLVGTIGQRGLIALACNCGGDLYSVDLADSLWSIDKNTAVGTAIGNLGYNVNYGQDADFDPANGVLYLAAFNNTTNTGQLRTAYLTTGNSTLLMDWGSLQITDFGIAGSCGPPCPVGAPTNPSPANGATNIPIIGNTLSWSNSAGTTANEVWFDNEMVYDGSPITSYLLSPQEPLSYYTTYRWKVVCKNDTCETSGPTWILTTMQDSNLASLFCDDFEGGTGNWTITNDGGTCVWDISTLARHYLLQPTASGNVFAADADLCGSGTALLSTATLTPLNLSGVSGVSIEWDNDWRTLNANDEAYLEGSSDGGTTWISLWERVGVDARYSREIVDASTFDGQSSVIFRLRSVQPGWDWWWAIDNFCIYSSRVTDVIDVETDGPLTFGLEQNYPNPFNPSTKISFTVPEKAIVSLKVYDVIGNEVAILLNEEKPAGTYEVEFNSHSGNSRNLTSGVYFYKLQAGTYVETKKMVLMK